MSRPRTIEEIKSLTFTASKTDMLFLDAICEDQDISRSQLLRQLIRKLRKDMQQKSPEAA